MPRLWFRSASTFGHVQRRGAALPLVLVVVLAASALLVGWALLTRAVTVRLAETERLAQADSLVEAALGLALADIQTRLGPDPRATSGVGLRHPSLTGPAAEVAEVWATETGTALALGALASGVGENGTLEFAPGVAAGVVAVPWGDATNGARGEFAWVAFDPTLRAPLEALAPATTAPPAEVAARQREGQSGPAWAGVLAGVVPASDARWSHLTGVAHAQQAGLLPFTTPTAVVEALAWGNRGLLRDGRRGGARISLAEGAALTTVGLDAVAQTWLRPALPGANGGPGALELKAPAVLDGDPATWPAWAAPIVTEAALMVGFNASAIDIEQGVRARFHLEAELWNPWAVPLRLPADPAPNSPRPPVGEPVWSRPLRLVVLNLPSIRLRNVSKGRVTAWIDLNSALNQGPEGDYRFHSWLEVPLANGETQPVLPPGAVYRVREPRPSQPEGLARTLVRGFPVSTYDRIQLETRPASTGPVTFRLVPFQGYLPGADLAKTAAFPVLQEVVGLPFSEFTLEWPQAALGATPFLLNNSTTYRIDFATAIWHWRWQAWPEAGPVDAATDPRRARWPVAAAPWAAQVASGPLGSTAAWHPARLASERARLFAATELLHSPTLRALPPASEATAPRVLGADAAWGWPGSGLGALRHRPGLVEAAVQPWGLLDATHSPRGGYYRPLPGVATLPTTGVTAASHWVAGPFNVHSTSVPAWRLLLVAPDGADGGVLALGRLPWGAAHLATPPTDAHRPPESTDRWALWRSPYRRAEAAGPTAAALDRLAEAIVGRVRQHGPFASLEDFALRADLAGAIAASGLNEGLPEGSPLTLTATDLLARLGPRLTTRADTLVVWVAARVTTTSAGTSGPRRWLEVRLQRFPPPTEGAAGPLWRVVERRWRTAEALSWP